MLTRRLIDGDEQIKTRAMVLNAIVVKFPVLIKPNPCRCRDCGKIRSLDRKLRKCKACRTHVRVIEDKEWLRRQRMEERRRES